MTEDHEKILIVRDTTCRQCSSELPGGTEVMQDRMEPQDGVFCSTECWAQFYKVDEPDQAREDGLRGQY